MLLFLCARKEKVDPKHKIDSTLRASRTHENSQRPHARKIFLGACNKTSRRAFIGEILTFEQLDTVNGGTNGEYRELREILPTVMRTFYSDYGTKHPNYMTTDEVQDWLKSNLKIDAKIDAGAWYNPFDSAGNANTYSRNGQSLTHAQVVAECKQFFGK